MTTETWHCDADLLRRYETGNTDAALSASIEAHLVGCDICRATVVSISDDAASAALWSRVRDVIETPALPWPLPTLQRFGLSREDGVLLRASQSFRGPWTFAVVVVLIAAAWAAFPDEPRGKLCYLLLAPLVPVLGVVTAFATIDPARDLIYSTPYPKARLALLRSAAVVTTTVPFVAAMGAVVPGVGWLSVAWLGPALGLSLTALALLTWLSPRATGGVVMAGWTTAISITYAHTTVVSVVHLHAQISYLCLAALTALILTARIRSAHFPGEIA